MAEIKKIHHVGIATTDIDQALKFWKDALGLKVDRVEEVPDQKVQVAFIPLGESEVELLKPTTAESATAKFLAERGGGMHHLCLEVDDLKAKLSDLKAKDVRLINEEPLVLPGRKMAFVHPKSTGGVLLELYEITE
jgi:methylmalonyl-CoA/ethylmalonyl-CoA epimerase